MAKDYSHLKTKAIQLRTEQHYTLEQLMECLQLPKTTIWYWIKDHPIPETSRTYQTEKRRLGRLVTAEKNKKHHEQLRQRAYEQGLAEFDQLNQDRTFRDFVVAYMCEGYKRTRHTVSFINSDPKLIILANKWLARLSSRKLDYQLQYHNDHDPDELKDFWADLLNISAESIRFQRKSNSNQLAGRKFRSVHGVFTVRTNDTYLMARLQAWIDTIKKDW